VILLVPQKEGIIEATFDCFLCEMIELPKHDMEHCNFSFAGNMEHIL